MSEREQDSRRQRLAALREAGVDPFPPRTGPRTPIAEVREKVTATVLEPTDEKLCNLTHESFTGQIKIKRVASPGGVNRGKRRRRP